MKRKVKGIHDITTSLQRPKIVTPPRVWSFSTKPKFRRFQKSIEKTLFVERVEEPKTNVFEKMDNLVIMAELPEMKKEDIQWEISSDIFSIRAQDKFGSKKYMKEILLPFVVDENNIQTSYRNGIFEISFRRKKEKKK
ncbi:MAG: Hsp20/alpha crystallin family protein [Thermodesulfobacteriota bacterium]